tara:strand:+ start:28165 stop:28746 length:582 start_codon:yes stop_codon:yes gene_type:complete
MPKITYKEDQGKAFGKWTDKISRYIYFDSLELILSDITIPDNVADYGGANGNIKEFIPQAITIDIDSSKDPDINADILEYKGEHKLIIIRYVLHYLNDYEVIKLFKHIKSYHKGEILIIQFCNNDLISKYENSKNEFKYFRTEYQLEQLIPKESNLIFKEDIEITKDFYKNRLNLSGAKSHEETINAYLINYA